MNIVEKNPRQAYATFLRGIIKEGGPFYLPQENKKRNQYKIINTVICFMIGEEERISHDKLWTLVFTHFFFSIIAGQIGMKGGKTKKNVYSLTRMKIKVDMNVFRGLFFFEHSQRYHATETDVEKGFEAERYFLEFARNEGWVTNYG